MLDPADWGSDHVGKPIPEYVTGDECLFCHRMDVGPTWPANRHNLTLRPPRSDEAAVQALKEAPGLRGMADEVKLLLGNSERVRFLKRSDGYGKLDLHSVEWQPPSPGEDGRLVVTESPHWDAAAFGNRCAGCHTTAVDSKTRAFSALALDCFTCHGDVPLAHSKDGRLAHLGKKRTEPAAVTASICGQCHLRDGTSVSTGLPYPNNFVAGDNLFRDFKVDLSPETIAQLNPADGHVLDNIRHVVLLAKEEMTCLTCHDVHSSSTRKHHRLAKQDYCWHCHNPTGSMKDRKPYEVHSKACGY